MLKFGEPSQNALDAVGDRDVVLDFVEACMRAVLFASRPSEELVLWATPAFGYVRLDDAASTGSSLMPQKRNPDPFELIRGAAGALIGPVHRAPPRRSKASRSPTTAICKRRKRRRFTPATKRSRRSTRSAMPSRT